MLNYIFYPAVPEQYASCTFFKDFFRNYKSFNYSMRYLIKTKQLSQLYSGCKFVFVSVIIILTIHINLPISKERAVKTLNTS